MSSANCCMTQKPSSPDSLAPRPRQLRPPPGSLLPASRRYDTGSLCLSSSSTVSPLSKQEDIAELQAIFDEDRSSTSHAAHFPKAKQSSGSLATVKDKLKKHLSREQRVHKRHSKSSVGTSEGEIERRAELRRIRRRRIQEELSSEFGYDSDAKSLPSIAGAHLAEEGSGGYRAAGCGPPFPVTGSPDKWTQAPSSPSQIASYLEE
jgi:hypothetical protein